MKLIFYYFLVIINRIRWQHIKNIQAAKSRMKKKLANPFKDFKVPSLNLGSVEFIMKGENLIAVLDTQARSSERLG